MAWLSDSRKIRDQRCCVVEANGIDIPQAWKKVTDIMLPKKQSSKKLNKLRIIVLFDALHNLMNKNRKRNDSSIRKVQLDNKF